MSRPPSLRLFYPLQPLFVRNWQRCSASSGAHSDSSLRSPPTPPRRAAALSHRPTSAVEASNLKARLNSSPSRPSPRGARPSPSNTGAPPHRAASDAAPSPSRPRPAAGTDQPALAAPRRPVQEWASGMFEPGDSCRVVVDVAVAPGPAVA